MNKNDSQQIKELTASIEKVIASLNQNLEALTRRVNHIEEVTNKTHKPLEMEGQILDVACRAIYKSVEAALVSYDSPLTKLVKSVIDEQSPFLKGIVSDSFSEVIKKDTFKQAIVSAFSHRVARTIISNNDGLFDKVSNELKQSSEFKAKMTLAVANVVNECLTDKKNESTN